MLLMGQASSTVGTASPALMPQPHPSRQSAHTTSQQQHSHANEISEDEAILESGNLIGSTGSMALESAASSEAARATAAPSSASTTPQLSSNSHYIRSDASVLLSDLIRNSPSTSTSSSHSAANPVEDSEDQVTLSGSVMAPTNSNVTINDGISSNPRNRHMFPSLSSLRLRHGPGSTNLSSAASNSSSSSVQFASSASRRRRRSTDDSSSSASAVRPLPKRRSPFSTSSLRQRLSQMGSSVFSSLRSNRQSRSSEVDTTAGTTASESGPATYQTADSIASNPAETETPSSSSLANISRPSTSATSALSSFLTRDHFPSTGTPEPSSISTSSDAMWAPPRFGQRVARPRLMVNQRRRSSLFSGNTGLRRNSFPAFDTLNNDSEFRRSLGSNNSNTSIETSRENQASMLARLLTIAATATATSLVGSSRSSSGVAYRGSSNSRASATNSSGEGGVGAEDAVDNSFDGFIAGLRSGLLASELASPTDGNNARRTLNFFRMFRFSPSETTTRTSVAGHVPVLIVGVRAVEFNEDMDTTAQHSAADFPFFDALSSRSIRMNNPRNNPSTSTASAAETAVPTVASSIPSNTSSSTGTTSNSDEEEDANDMWNIHQHDHNEDATRPRITRTTLDLDQESSILDYIRDVTENQDREQPQMDITPSTHTPSSTSLTSDETPARRDQSQSWIVYVFGGSYPENHPILLAPSLFTDDPSYEDLLILETFLGQAKPPVATKEEVDKSGGELTVGSPAFDGTIITAEERCLVCLSHYEMDEHCRKLSKCGHIFHRDCIDQWLIKGRNSCPLCRGEGVESVAAAARA